MKITIYGWSNLGRFSVVTRTADVPECSPNMAAPPLSFRSSTSFADRRIGQRKGALPSAAEVTEGWSGARERCAVPRSPAGLIAVGSRSPVPGTTRFRVTSYNTADNAARARRRPSRYGRPSAKTGRSPRWGIRDRPSAEVTTTRALRISFVCMEGRGSPRPLRKHQQWSPIWDTPKLGDVQRVRTAAGASGCGLPSMAVAC